MPDFWYHYWQLSDEIQDLADRYYELLKQDSRYPSLHFKKVGQFWLVQIGIHYGYPALTLFWDRGNLTGVNGEIHPSGKR
jgi:hypothetical protein